jgi:hypothetical protein
LQDGHDLGGRVVLAGREVHPAGELGDGRAVPVRQLGAQLIQDLHPNDRGTNGTHMGATCANGNLYCPATPNALLTLGPLAPAATTKQTEAHDQQTAELAKYKLSPITAY